MEEIKNKETVPKKKIIFDNKFFFGGSFFSEKVEGKSNLIVSKSNWDTKYELNKKNFKNSISSKMFSGMIENIGEYINTIINSGIKVINLSISWSNLFKKEDKINEDIRLYYFNLFEKLKQANIQIILSIVKFDLPSWFIDKGAFFVKENYKYFRDFVRFIIINFGNYINVFYLFDDPLYMFILSNLENKENVVPNLGKKQKFITLISNISLFSSKIISEFKNEKIKFGIKHKFTPIIFNDQKGINFNIHSKLYKYNFILNFALLDLIINGNKIDILEFCDKFNLSLNLSDDEMNIIMNNKIDFLGISYNNIIFVSNEKNEFPFDLFNEILFYSNNEVNQNDSIEYIKEIIKIINYKYRNIPIVFHFSYRTTKKELKDWSDDERRVNDNDRINYLCSFLSMLNESINEIPNKCIGFVYEDIFDCWNYFDTNTIYSGLIQFNFISNLVKKLIPKASYYWYKRLSSNKYFYNFHSKDPITKNVSIEAMTKLIDIIE